jgi:nucleotide-binding universal stress UspA family protein
LEHPFVADALDGHAKSTGNDFIIMTTHGRGPLSRFWLGSVADELVRRATVPLLLIRPLETAPDFASEPQLRRIAIPLDGSTLAEQVLESAIGLGSLMQADYTLVHIYGPLVDSGVDPLNYATVGGHELSLEQRRTDAESYLNRVAKRLKERGFTVETHVGFAQHPASAILDSAEHLGMSLIALETHGRRGLTRLLLGSVADKVIRGASIPVLVHRSATSPSAG